MPIHMQSAGSFQEPPEGSHIAVCYRAIDLGTQRRDFQGQVSYKRQLLLTWELPDEHMDDGRPFSVSRFYTLSSHPRASLRLDLESWRGKPFAADEIDDFDISTLLGAACMVSVIHGDTGRAKVSGIMKLPKGMPLRRSTINTPVSFSLDDRPFDWNTYESFGEKMKAMIANSPEFKAAVEGREPSEFQPPSPQVSENDLDDAIPF